MKQMHCADYTAGKITRLPAELQFDPQTGQRQDEEALRASEGLFTEVQRDMNYMNLQPSI